MWKAKISFRTEDGVVKNHKFFPSSNPAKCAHFAASIVTFIHHLTV